MSILDRLLTDGRTLPKQGLLVWIKRPNSDNVLDDEATLVDESLADWGYALPVDAAVYAILGNGFWYTDADTPITRTMSEIMAWPSINQFGVLANAARGWVAVYDTAVAGAATMAKAYRVIKDDYPEGTLHYPAGAILHHDANKEPFEELTGGVHIFNHSVGSPMWQLNADGSYTDVAPVGNTKPAVDTFSGEKWLRSCGAVVNLLPGDTSIARSVTLSAVAYTLQVFGAGSASCSYGTATASTPLTFTATAGTTLFTPAGAARWMLRALSYPLEIYVPPGVSQPASNATTTNGCWFRLPDGSELWQALTGSPLTLATRVRMGVGSGDLASTGVYSNLLSCNAVFGSSSMTGYGKTSMSVPRTHFAYDGTTYAYSPDLEWNRGTVITRYLQVNTAGTQYRVGYIFDGVHSAIQWGSWVNYDGSFSPSTAYKLLLGLSISFPMWFNKITVWKRQVPDNELLGAWT